MTVWNGAILDGRWLCSTWSIRNLGSYPTVVLPSQGFLLNCTVITQSQAHQLQLTKRRTYPTS